MDQDRTWWPLPPLRRSLTESREKKRRERADGCREGAAGLRGVKVPQGPGAWGRWSPGEELTDGGAEQWKGGGSGGVSWAGGGGGRPIQLPLPLPPPSPSQPPGREGWGPGQGEREAEEEVEVDKEKDVEGDGV